MNSSLENIGLFQKNLLDWYDKHQRSLPWRAKPGSHPNPYDVWLSEVMLQQTTVATVIPYFLKFKQRWPTLVELAQAKLDDIFHLWQGLGYYQRARNLQACAQVVVEKYGGQFPSEYELLLDLPGIGPYTAGAICCIAFNRPAPVVDGNIERVMSRFLKFEGTFPKQKKQFGQIIWPYCPPTRSGDYVQALMDLGATLCKGAQPACQVCPLASLCEANRQNCAQNYPKKTPKSLKKTLFGVVFWVKNEENDHIYIQKRPEKGLLAGLMELPSTPWTETPASDFPASGPKITHTFTHVHLELTLVCTQTLPPVFQGGVWIPVADVDKYAFPTLMKKVIQTAKGLENEK